MENQKADLNKLAKSWKSPFVARGSIREFSGGLIHPRTLANMDSKGIYKCRTKTETIKEAV